MRVIDQPKASCYGRVALRHVRGGGGHPGEQPGGRPDALRQVVQGASGDYRSPHVRAFCERGRYRRSHKKVTRKNGARKLMKTRTKNWCGEGDLNPHEIAPASTSS